ncbi:MAG: alginate lyase family protein [Asticcacaulis sp.]|uniref:alginate lyase family protein n=1 Tax=Asticcacaulis sp. TaxID=1872648 RepID=UPI0039E24D33
MSHYSRRLLFHLVGFVFPAIVPAARAWAGGSSYDSAVPSRTFDGLKSPYDVDGRRASIGAPEDDLDCEMPPPPVTILDHESKYASGTHSSVVDPKLEAAYQDKLEAVSDFYNPLARISDRYMKSRPRATEIAMCASNWLESWAEAQALEQGVTEQGRMVQAWALASLSTTYLKIRTDPYLSSQANETIVNWLARLNTLVIANFETNASKDSRSNNHRYWANWAVCATAIVLNDQEAFAWASDGFDRACNAVTPEGTLPLEMARRGKALHYHNFSLGPLVLHAEALIANGRLDAYEAGGGGIKRLATKVVAGLDDPDIFADLAGTKQDLSGTLKDTQLAWMEPYYARFQAPELKKWLNRYRPMVAQRLGGDLTFLFGTTVS